MAVWRGEGCGKLLENSCELLIIANNVTPESGIVCDDLATTTKNEILPISQPQRNTGRPCHSRRTAGPRRERIVRSRRGPAVRRDHPICGSALSDVLPASVAHSPPWLPSPQKRVHSPIRLPTSQNRPRSSYHSRRTAAPRPPETVGDRFGGWVAYVLRPSRRDGGTERRSYHERRPRGYHERRHCRTSADCPRPSWNRPP